MAAVFKLVNDFFQGIAERRIGASKIERKELMSATAAECTRLDTFGNKGIATDYAEGILDGFDLVPAVFADHTEGGFANNLLTQSTSTRKDNTQEGINKRRDAFGILSSSIVPRGPGRIPRASFFLKKTLFLKFLASNAVSRPRNSFKSLLLNFIFAGNARAELSTLKPLYCFVYQLKSTSLITALTEQKLLGIGVGSLVGNILRRILIGLTPILLCFRNCFEKIGFLFQKFLLEMFVFFRIHSNQLPAY